PSTTTGSGKRPAWSAPASTRSPVSTVSTSRSPSSCCWPWSASTCAAVCRGREQRWSRVSACHGPAAASCGSSSSPRGACARSRGEVVITATEHATHAPHEAHGGHDGTGEHVEHGDWYYGKIAIALAIITGLEVALSYADVGALFMPALLIMMAVKFFMVASF